MRTRLIARFLATNMFDEARDALELANLVLVGGVVSSEVDQQL